MWPSHLLGHHLVQPPDDWPPRRRPQRHAKTKSVDRHGVCGPSGVEVVNHACAQGGKNVFTSLTHTRAEAKTARPIQGVQAGLQRRQSVRLRMNVPHMFYMRPDPGMESSETVAAPRKGLTY